MLGRKDLKGVTVYVDGSRDPIILYRIKLLKCQKREENF